MKAPSYLIFAVVLSLAGCGDNSDKSKAANTTNTSSAGTSPLNAPADYLGAMGKAQQSAVKTAESAKINQAIQMFNVEQGRNPKSLGELVEQKYLPKIPDAPYGMKFQYDAEKGRVSVVKQ